MEKIKAFFKKAGLWFKACYSWLTGFGADKYLHFIAGVLITLFFAALWPLGFASCLFGFFAGVAKEVLDEWRGGQFDWCDAVSTMAGALTAQAFIWCYIGSWDVL